MKILMLILGFVTLLPAAVSWGEDQTVPPPASKRFYVLGEVNKPGDFEFQPGVTVKSAIETAEGLSARADRHKGVVIRENKDRVQFDPQEILDGKSQDIPLEPGDTVIVLPGSIKVLGKVRGPGSFDYQTNMTILDAVSAAGGMLPEADAQTIYVEREGKTITVDLSRPGEDAGGAFKLQVGDVVYVPEHGVTITGEVKNPGQYTLVPGEKGRLRDLVNMAGGATPRANLKKVQVQSVLDGQRPTATYNLTSVEASQNPVLRRGDTVVVPTMEEKKKRIGLGEVYQAVAIVYLLVQIFK